MKIIYRIDSLFFPFLYRIVSPDILVVTTFRTVNYCYLSLFLENNCLWFVSFAYLEIKACVAYLKDKNDKKHAVFCWVRKTYKKILTLKATFVYPRVELDPSSWFLHAYMLYVLYGHYKWRKCIWNTTFHLKHQPLSLSPPDRNKIPRVWRGNNFAITLIWFSWQISAWYKGK